MNKKILYILLVLTMISSLPVVAKSKEYGNMQGKVKVLIAQEPTRFKKKLVEEMIAILDDGKTYIKVVDHKKKELRAENPADYTIVFITNSGVNSRVRPWVKDWLDKYSADRSKIVVHTTQREVWTPKIDTLTSASTMSESKRLAVEYTNKMKTLLQ